MRGLSALGFTANQRAVKARAYHSIAQSVADVTLTALALDSERRDTDTIHDTVTNNTRLTCKTAGQYAIAGGVRFASNATGFRQVSLRLNGTVYLATQAFPAVSGAVTQVGVATLEDLVVGDYLELVVYQSSGGALNVEAFPNASPELAMTRVGP